ncbi:MAG TPA: ABC transporter permease [Pseudomonadales bacterium]|nr:ABC transporter permease [Pseudomonadales bacterium]
MAETVIEVRDLTRTYQTGDVAVHALRGVSVRIERGEFVAIMGSSGSGKSTLMSILGCLDRPTSGNYLFEGVDVAQCSETELANIRSARIGFVFQSFNLLARTSAIENAALPLFYSAHAPDAGERAERARHALELLGLGHRESNTPAQLSGGEQQRVAIARALINTPSVLLADEPTGNLDTRNSHDIMQTLVRFNREQGVTIVVVTHEPDIAAYASRVITMRDGAVLTDERKADAAAATTATPVPQPNGAAPSRGVLRAIADRRGFFTFASMIGGAALQALARNKMRSALTMLGVFIGVAALIAMVAVGQGANEAVKAQIASLGTNMFIVVPGSRSIGGSRGGFGSATTLTVTDAEAIRRELPSVALVGYTIRQSGQVQYGDQNWTTTIQAVTASYPDITNWRVESGRSISEQDVANAALVAVIGHTVFLQLFGENSDAVGARILVKGIPLRVVGVFAAKGQSAMGQDQDDIVMIPFTTGERKVLGVAAPTVATTTSTTTTTATASGSNSITTAAPTVGTLYPTLANPYGISPRLTGFVNVIYVQAVSAADVDKAVDDVTQLLMRRHHIQNDNDADFNVRNLSQIASAAEGSAKIMAALLAVVASISLLVGGIGIMNILLVSVTERTREIGLRMAIGAQRVQVLLQFLAEAVILSVTGGLAGILFGVLVTQAIARVAEWPTLVSLTAIVVGFLFSAAIGIFFGYYPARKAARLNPIEALRYE